MYDFPHRKNSIADDCPLSFAFLAEDSVSESAMEEAKTSDIHGEAVAQRVSQPHLASLLGRGKDDDWRLLCFAVYMYA